MSFILYLQVDEKKFLALFMSGYPMKRALYGIDSPLIKEIEFCRFFFDFSFTLEDE